MSTNQHHHSHKKIKNKKRIALRLLWFTRSKNSHQRQQRLFYPKKFNTASKDFFTPIGCGWLSYTKITSNDNLFKYKSFSMVWHTTFLVSSNLKLLDYSSSDVKSPHRGFHRFFRTCKSSQAKFYHLFYDRYYPNFHLSIISTQITCKSVSNFYHGLIPLTSINGVIYANLAWSLKF
jgi:hypothetical protein